MNKEQNVNPSQIKEGKEWRREYKQRVSIKENAIRYKKVRRRKENSKARGMGN